MKIAHAIIGWLFASTLLVASSINASTISAEIIMPAEIILTYNGFRQLSDCRTEWLRRVWRDGHYWSVRPTWVCDDAVYVGGKFGGPEIDGATAQAVAPVTFADAIFRPTNTGQTRLVGGELYTVANAFVQVSSVDGPSPRGGSIALPDGPSTALDIPSVVPISPSIAMMLTALMCLLSVGFMKRSDPPPNSARHASTEDV